MRGSLELGRVWGISIRLHGSWLVVFGLVAWSLAQGYLPAQHPGWRPVTYWAVGAATGLLFFASVLVHELGHARMALRHGLSTRSITLFVFGGVAGIRREPPSPGIELQIALAGPLTSLALAGLFAPGLVSPHSDDRRRRGLAAQMNLALAVFNTLPGFPLDGGRILRAALWWWTGRLHRATQLAAFTGQILAFGLVAVGAVAALGGNFVTGIWLAFLGWFLHGAATAASTESGLRELLRGVTVEQAMSRDYARVPPELPLDRRSRTRSSATAAAPSWSSTTAASAGC
jgi:Zn-dependent protease